MLPAGLGILAGAAAAGLYATIALPVAAYAQLPALLDAQNALAVGAAFSILLIALWVIARTVLFRRNGKAAEWWVAAFIPLTSLAAVFIRPFGDSSWSMVVLAIASAGVIVVAWGRDFALRAYDRRRLAAAWREHLLALAATSIAFFVYLRTLAPSVVIGDSAEFQTVAPTMGIAHPTGYPLYLLLGKAFSFLPWGNAAYRLNLVSAVSAALAVYLLILTARKLNGDTLASVASGLLVAFSGVFWSQAVIAEVYALNAFFAVLLLYLIARGMEKSAAAQQDDRRHLHPYALWPAFGLALTHHRTALLLAPALTVYALIVRPRALLNPRALVVALALFALPLTLYLYLPIRWPVINGDALTWNEFQRQALASGYAFALRPDALLAEPARYAYFLRLGLEQFTVPGAAVGVLGFFVLAFSRWRLALLTALAFAAFALFPVAYHVPDVAVFSIPSLLVFALWVAVGLGALTRAGQAIFVALSSRLDHSVSHQTVAGMGALFFSAALLIPGSLLVANYGSNDQSNNRSVDRWGRAASEQPIPAGSVVVADLPRMSALRYFFGVESPAPHLLLMPDDAPTAAAIVADSVAAGKPTFLARYLPELHTKYRLNASGPLVSVSLTTPETTAWAEVGRAMTLPIGIVLAGADLPATEVAAGDDWHVALYWQARVKQNDSYFVHLRLASSDGDVAWSAKPGIPVQGLYPTWAWPAGALIADYRELTLPIDLPPDTYDINVGLGGAFRPPERWVSVGALRVTSSQELPVLRPMLAVFGEQLALLGYDVIGDARAGSIPKLALRWQALGDSPTGGLQAETELLDGSGAVLARHVFRNLLPSGELAAGTSFVSFRALPLPADLVAGTYRLRVRLGNGEGEALRVFSGWLARRDQWAALGEFGILPPAETALATFEDQAVLMRSEIVRDHLLPGDTLRVTLYWQAIAKIGRDFTVFVHLLDGVPRVRAQSDAMPGGGLMPTSRWRPDEVVADAYEIMLPRNLPAGEYQVEVGMYDAGNMQRLVVVNGDRQPVDDRVLIGKVFVAESDAH